MRNHIRLALSAVIAASLCLLSVSAATYTPSNLVRGSFSLGADHIIAVEDGGALYAWGDDSLGQLGNGSGGSVSAPTAIALANVVKAAACGGNSMAITEDGKLYSWGFNELGQVGDDTAVSPDSPRMILENVTSAALGGNNGAAITENGDLYVWGHNFYGQVGVGTTVQAYSAPQAVDIPTPVASVAVGMWHVAAVTVNGDLYVCGCDEYGQVGDGDEEDATYYSNKTGDVEKEPDQLTPQKVMSGVSFAVVGDDRTAAVKNDGSLYIWGDNSYGQIGNGGVKTAYEPVLVSGVSHVSGVVLGTTNTLAITENGDLYVWGSDLCGLVGDGGEDEIFYEEYGFSIAPDQLTPEKVLPDVASASIGGRHMAAVTYDGELYMWGANDMGQLGDGSFSGSNKPVSVMTSVDSVALGENTSAALDRNGKLYTWGFVLGENVSLPTEVMSEVQSPFNDRTLEVEIEPGENGVSTVALPENSSRITQGEVSIVQADGQCIENEDGSFTINSGQSAYAVIKDKSGKIIDALMLSAPDAPPKETEALVCQIAPYNGQLEVTGIIGSRLNRIRFVSVYTAVYSETGRLLSLSVPNRIDLDSPATIAKVSLNVSSWTEGCAVKLMVLSSAGSFVPLCEAGEYVSNSN